MKLKTMCDMASIKIFNEGMSCFFSNGFGDGENTVNIYKKSLICGKKYDDLSKERQKAKDNFLGHFTVKDKAYLSDYDCEDSPAYTFDKGRWFVYLEEPMIFHIEKIDEDIHA